MINHKHTACGPLLFRLRRVRGTAVLSCLCLLAALLLFSACSFPSAPPSQNSDRPSTMRPLPSGDDRHSADLPSEKPSDERPSDARPSGELPSDSSSDGASDSSGAHTSEDSGSGVKPPDIPSDLSLLALPAGNAPDGYLDEIMFLGDSTTYGLRFYRIFGEKNTPRVWTPKSGTLALFNASTEKIYDAAKQEELSLADMAARYKPKYLIVTLGVNGVSMMRESYFKSEYGKVIQIIKNASPATRIILQTMYPVATTCKVLKPETICKGNRWIYDIAAENGCRVLDSYAWFLDENGYLDLQYENRGDGMHFNASGYRHMLEFVAAHPYPDAADLASPSLPS